MKLNVDRKLTILIALWILDKLIMLSMFLFFAQWCYDKTTEDESWIKGSKNPKVLGRCWLFWFKSLKENSWNGPRWVRRIFWFGRARFVMGVAMSGEVIDKIKGILDEFEDADFFSLETKKKIAEMVVAELEDLFAMERGL